MYNLLHKEQLHVSALFIGHLQVKMTNEKYNLLHKEQLHVSALFIGHLQVKMNNENGRNM